MDAAVMPASSAYDALCEEFTVETGALCGALSSENPALLLDHMAKIFPADDLLPLIDELGTALQRTPPRPAFFEALREELSASSGDSTATTDGLRLDEAGLRALEHVRALTDAHHVDTSTFGIPRAEQDADGELLLGKCKQCGATRLLSSLAEHEASCRPDEVPPPSRQPPAAASLSAAAEGPPSASQGVPAPKKRTQKAGPGRPQKRPRAESAPAGVGVDPAGSLPGSWAPWAAQQPAKRLPPLHPGTATANAAQPASEAPVQHPFVPISSAPAARPKPVVKLKQPPAAAKSSSPAAALNAAWANFPMPTDFMSEDFGSLPQGMDWLNSADLAGAPAPASAPGESAPSKAAAKAAAKATAKAAASAAQKAAAKRAANKKRALAAAPNPRMGLFQAFTHHPRKKRSASFKRRPRTNLKAPGQQPGAFAEVIASLAGDSPVAQQPQQRPAAQRPRQRLPAPQAGQEPRMRHPAALAHASLDSPSAMPSLSPPQQLGQKEQAARAPAEPEQPAQAGQGERRAQPSQSHPGQPAPRQQMTKPYIPQAVLQKAQAERSVEPIKAYLRHQQMLRQQQLLQQQAGSPQQEAHAREEHTTSSRPPASLPNGQAYSSQQLPAPVGSMIPITSQPSAHRLSGPHVRFGQGATQGRQSSSGPGQQQQQAQAQHSAQQQEALRALYMQRTGQPYPAASAAMSQAGSPLRRSSTQHPYSGVSASAQSNPMSAAPSSQGYRHASSPQQGPFGSPTAMMGSSVSSSQYMQPTHAAPRASVSQAQAGSGAGSAGHPAVSFGQQAAQAGQPAVSFGQQQPSSQPQHYFMSQQQQSGAMQQYYQAQNGLPAYRSAQNGVLGLQNSVNPLKGSRLGSLPQPEPSQTMRWIPTSITPPTDKLASMQQLNPMPGARPEDSAQPLMGNYKFQY